VIVELSFKLHPLPQSRGSVLAAFDELDAAAEVVKRVMRSPLGPSSIEALDADAAGAIGSGLAVPADGCGMVFLVSGFEKAVARVTDEIAGLCCGSGRAETRADDDAGRGLWSAIRDLADASDPTQPVLKLAVPPAQSIAGLGHLRQAVRRRGLEASLLAHAGTGLVYARFARRDWGGEDLDQLAAVVADARSFAVEREGSLVVETCPTALKRRVDVWGEIGPPLKLMQSLKERLDPRGTLNPGRYVGGI
jgi:glycolate oxidase FAD binding subunit